MLVHNTRLNGSIHACLIVSLEQRLSVFYLTAVEKIKLKAGFEAGCMYCECSATYQY